MAVARAAREERASLRAAINFVAILPTGSTTEVFFDLISQWFFLFLRPLPHLRTCSLPFPLPFFWSLFWFLLSCGHLKAPCFGLPQREQACLP